MTHTRWKLLAGCFGIAMCGLAALAGASRKSPLAMGCHYRPLVSDDPRQVEAVIPVQPVLMGAVEKKWEEAATKPPVVVIPTIPPAPTLAIESPRPLAINPVPPVIATPVNSPGTKNVYSEMKAEVVPGLAATPEVTLSMRMTGGLPTVEIWSKTGSFLMISCEQIDIAARGPKDDLPSSIKACGRVKFSTSGCQGTCEELVFNPNSMEGTMRNAVKLLCTQGGPTTELMADQIAFQLRPDSKGQFSISGADGSTKVQN